MLLGVFIRGVKNYKTINFIPFSRGDRFSAILGENGIGKSAVFESLDFFFNDSTLNLNHEWKRNTKTPPYVVPVFILNKNSIGGRGGLEKKYHNDLKEFSNVLWEVELKNFNQSQRAALGEFLVMRDSLKDQFKSEEYLLIVSGRGHQKDLNQGVFGSLFDRFFEEKTNTIQKDDDVEDDDVEDDDVQEGDVQEGDETGGGDLSSLVQTLETKFFPQRFHESVFGWLRKYYTFVYVPAEVDVEAFSRIEGVAIQRLSGKSVEQELKKIFSKDVLRDINNQFIALVEDLQSRLDGYVYRKDAQRQRNIGFYDLYDRLLNSFFSIRVLNKEVGDKGGHIAVSKASSGEKRKALVDLSTAFLSGENRTRVQKERVILAIDEPEISLDVGSVFEQFESLFELSRHGVQVLISTHWYGFIPALPRGGVTHIFASNDSSRERETIFLDLLSYRDSMKKEGERLRERFTPAIGLKSQFDLVQSILASLRREDGDRWVICEGYSDKIYLEHYFSRYVEESVKILPMAGSSGVTKLYQYLEVPLRDEKKHAKGRAICLIDTDENISGTTLKDVDDVLFMRRFLAREEGEPILLKSTDSTVSPPTEIEDLLEVQPLAAALQELNLDGYNELAHCFDECLDQTKVAKIALDMRRSEDEKLKLLYESGELKVSLADIFVKKHNQLELSAPSWFREVCDLLDLTVLENP